MWRLSSAKTNTLAASHFQSHDERRLALVKRERKREKRGKMEAVCKFAGAVTV